MIRANIRRAFRLSLRRRDRWEREVEDEIKLHLTLRAEQLIASGAMPDEAYREAVRKFGPLAKSRARLFDAARHRETRMQRIEHLSDVRQDLAFAIRTLRRDKGWTVVTILTLALGIAATTAVFSVVSSLLLHAMPYPHADRVVIVFEQPTQGNNTGVNVTISPNSQVVRAWKGARSFEALEAFAAGQSELRTTGAPVTLNIAEIEPTFPRFAGVQPILGRMFTPAEVAAHDHRALLGEGVWRARFAADTAVIGKAITLDDSMYTVVGVLPAKLQTPRVGAPPTDVWLPFDLRNENVGASVVGRLAPGVDLDRAARELDSAYARSIAGNKIPFRSVVTTPARRVSFRDSLIMLASAVALVLLVACMNVAHLLMARSSSRRRELAIRVALGAGRERVFRQLLTESVLLAVLGGSLGVLAGWVGLKAIVAMRPPSLSTLEVARLDPATLGLAIAVTVITSIAFGVMGAVQSARTSTHDALKSGGNRSAVTGRGRARQLLVVTEMALSATLVVGTTMLVRSIMNMQSADLGFEPKGLYALTLTSPKGHFANQEAKGELLRSVAMRLSSVPGVRSVALTSTPTSWFTFLVGRLEVEGEPVPDGPATSFINDAEVGSGYFRTMGIRLAQGTSFTDTTRAGCQVMVNERFARKQWRGESPVGKRIRVSSGDTKHPEPWRTIVGVVGDAQVGGPMTKEASAPFLYFPSADSGARAIMVRTEGTIDLARSIQAMMRSLDRDVTPKLESVEVQMAQSISAPRFVMLLLTTFTVLALVLAAIGLYGVMAYSVAQRTREIGIRVALGATRNRIGRTVVGSGVTLALFGSIVGIGIASWGTKLIQNQLYGVAQRDTVSFVASVVVLFGVGVLACVVPARRALAVDPMTAIRAD